MDAEADVGAIAQHTIWTNRIFEILRIRTLRVGRAWLPSAGESVERLLEVSVSLQKKPRVSAFEEAKHRHEHMTIKSLEPCGQRPGL
jgi:hypothetical protein